MDHSWSQILFLETRVKKFAKREIPERNVEGEASERHFILIYFIISFPWADIGTLVCLRWLQKERQKQASNLSHTEQQTAQPG